MKKILIIICSIFLLIGCKKQDVENPEKPNESGEHVIDPNYLTKEKISKQLYSYAIEIYKNKTYESFDKVDGKYYVSIKDLKEKYNYDTSMFVNDVSKNECDQEKTGIYIDIDNVEQVEYKEYPILISIYCD